MKQQIGNGFEKVKSFFIAHRKASIITISILAVLTIALIVLNATVFKQRETATTQTLTIQRGNVIQTLEIVGSTTGCSIRLIKLDNLRYGHAIHRPGG